ncbi:MAG: hypothetical protein QXT77_07425 [Candidatus Methanomethylicaceae archaeon]
MIFRATSIPKPAAGFRITDKTQVVPDKSLTLVEILKRFTRGEALPLGHTVNYGGDEDLDNPLNVDLEKVAFADLTEKDELKQQIEAVQAKHKEEEAVKAKKTAEAKAKAKAEAEEKRIQDEVEKRTKKASDRGQA